ncbi:stonustoxin subunit beta-like [Morone saxatilis]|uniref:stonustoxin subunit beta-like n=1 Tax=Morone saxatilis TaxID=34816 RepID=UPI0015E1DEE8|nr:stonustoxin subunit beta-like [Morone saxatilis]
MASNITVVAALGRPFTLGMLYDARKDELIPGLTLWDDKTLQDNITEFAHPSSKFEISTSDSLESKSSLLDIDASLKASFMGGLIEVGGSAKFLNDTKKYMNQSRVTFQYNATTTFKQLSMCESCTIDPGTMGKQKIDIIQKGFATHVVTGILYGADAVFVFDSEKLDVSKVRNIQGGMEAVIKKIPSLDIQGKVDIKLTDQEKDLTKNLSCKFYGDFILERNPGTFEEAVETYAELPKLLKERKENAVPLKVWLMPLKHFDSSAAKLEKEISVELVRKVQYALEDLKQIKMRCNDCLVDRIVENFPHIQEELSRFQKLCNHYESDLKQTLAKDLPSIREGKEEEESSKVQKLFEDREKSPLSNEKLNSWLDHKEREINIIRSCVEMMQGAKIVQTQSELDREVLAPGVEDALCFVFTSMERGDTFLDVMADYLKSPKLGSTDEDQWYYSDEVLIKMREKAKLIDSFAKALKNNSRFCFLVAAAANKKYTGATIYHYKDGILATDGFTKCDIPDVETVTDRRDLIWYACDLTLDPNTANNYLTLSEGNKKAKYGTWQTYPDYPERFDKLPQVLCRERLTGCHYWEVEWSNGYYDDVGVGVTYQRIGREGGDALSELGQNDISWYFGHSYGLHAWHNGKKCCGPLPYADCNRVGMFLDWPAGTLSFYRVSSNTLSHLHTFHTKFTEPVYPGFHVKKQDHYVYLHLAE